MMKALILNNKVIQVSETEFRVHPSMIWEECPDDVKVGYLFHGDSFSPPTYADIEEHTILSVGPLQMRRALRELGLYQTVKSYVETADEEIQEAWEYATEYKRDDPLFIIVQVALDATDEQIDNIFALASTK